MKKAIIIILAVLGVLAILIIAGGFWFKSNFEKMKLQVDSDYRALQQDVDLSTIEDGTYEGNYESFVLGVTLSVTVKDHAITDITISEQKSGNGYQGRAVIERIIAAQSLKVDARTGATGSSSVIILAVDRALRKTAD